MTVGGTIPSRLNPVDQMGHALCAKLRQVGRDLKSLSSAGPVGRRNRLHDARRLSLADV